ncbi:hypothetical protein MRB53_040647 [Persea americana]|nr:hypothetical protein MRB53_040647 [Persea americana]
MCPVARRCSSPAIAESCYAISGKQSCRSNDAQGWTGKLKSLQQCKMRPIVAACKAAYHASQFSNKARQSNQSILYVHSTLQLTAFNMLPSVEATKGDRLGANSSHSEPERADMSFRTNPSSDSLSHVSLLGYQSARSHGLIVAELLG